jgi:hypothetical protein
LADAAKDSTLAPIIVSSQSSTRPIERFSKLKDHILAQVTSGRINNRRYARLGRGLSIFPQSFLGPSLTSIRYGLARGRLPPLPARVHGQIDGVGLKDGDDLIVASHDIAAHVGDATRCPTLRLTDRHGNESAQPP